MTPRIRKLIGSLGMLVFLFAYVGGAAALGARLPDVFVLKLAYFAVAGVLWGLPLLPLIRWMNREP